LRKPNLLKISPHPSFPKRGSSPFNCYSLSHEEVQIGYRLEKNTMGRQGIGEGRKILEINMIRIYNPSSPPLILRGGTLTTYPPHSPRCWVYSTKWEE